MPVVRIYLPLGRADLDELAASGALAASPTRPRPAHAVTPALEQSAPGLDVEDLEYAAFSDAVTAARGARTAPGDRRIVAAADADPSWLAATTAGGQGNSPTSMALTDPLPVARVASIHIDEHNGVVEGTEAADADELLWYDVTELDEVRGLFG